MSVLFSRFSVSYSRVTFRENFEKRLPKSIIYIRFATGPNVKDTSAVSTQNRVNRNKKRIAVNSMYGIYTITFSWIIVILHTSTHLALNCKNESYVCVCVCTIFYYLLYTACAHILLHAQTVVWALKTSFNGSLRIFCCRRRFIIIIMFPFVPWSNGNYLNTPGTTLHQRHNPQVKI